MAHKVYDNKGSLKIEVENNGKKEQKPVYICPNGTYIVKYRGRTQDVTEIVNKYYSDKLEGAKVTSAPQIKAQAKYDKEHTKGVYLKLNKENDSDILDRLYSVENVQGYIKELIREDIKKSPR